jgi:2,4-dienoyl-CoA reductase-like NADH-dependent reductase (Old Yellow Enzyme family)
MVLPTTGTWCIWAAVAVAAQADHYRSRAVSAEGRITFADLGIYKDEHIEKLKEITDFIHQHGAIAGIQLAHAGRKASHVEPWNGGKQIPSDQPNGWKGVGPSAIPFADGEEAPIANWIKPALKK